jgi:hypothetical protein
MVNTIKVRRSSHTSEEEAKSTCLNEVNVFIQEKKLNRDDIIEYRTSFGTETLARIRYFFCEIIMSCWFENNK